MSFDRSFIFSLDEIDTVVQYLKDQFSVCKVFAFYGPPGAGKSTIVRSLLRSCGITDVITSPTFTYLNLYKNGQGQAFYHFDLYRVKNLKDFLAAGFGEYLQVDEKGWVLVEWPEVIEPLLQEKVCHVKIDYHEDVDKRLANIYVVE